MWIKGEHPTDEVFSFLICPLRFFRKIRILVPGFWERLVIPRVNEVNKGVV